MISANGLSRLRIIKLYREVKKDCVSTIGGFEFETATFLLDPHEAGTKLKRQVMHRLLLAMPVRVIKLAKQPDQMLAEELKVLLEV